MCRRSRCGATRSTPADTGLDRRLHSQRIFAADAATGTILPWAPEINAGDGGALVVGLGPGRLRNRLYAGGDFTQVRVSLATGSPSSPKCPPPSSDCTIVGTSNNDILSGTSGQDVICGRGGADIIRGLGGNDTLRGEGEPDKLIGGEGDDILDGGSSSADTAEFSDSLSPVNASLTGKGHRRGVRHHGSDREPKRLQVQRMLAGSVAINQISGEAGTIR